MTLLYYTTIHRATASTISIQPTAAVWDLEVHVCSNFRTCAVTSMY